MRLVIKRQIEIPGDPGSDDSGILGVNWSIKKKKRINLGVKTRI